MPESEKGRADGGGDRYPLASEEAQGLTQGLVEATLTAKPYPIKAWIVYGQNVLESIPQKQITREAMKQLELLVVVEVLPTSRPTTRTSSCRRQPTWSGMIRRTSLQR